MQEYEAVKEELHVVVKAIDILAKIMSSPIEYEQDGLYKSCSLDTQNEDCELEKLQQEWKLEETSIPRLYNNCRQVREHLRLTSIEASQAVDEIQTMTDKLYEAQVKNQELSKLALRLQEENIQLKQQNQSLTRKLIKRKKRNDNMVSLVRQYLQKNNEMKVEEEDVEEDKSANGITEVSEDSSATDESKNKNEWESHTAPSSPLSVIDFGCSTVYLAEKVPEKMKFRLPLKNTWGANTSFTKKNSNATNPSRSSYSLTLPTGNIGLQFLQVERYLGCSDPDESKHKVRSTTSLLVCGYDGFILSDKKQKPTFGAKLICVDDTSLTSQLSWDLKSLNDYLLNKKMKDDYVKFTFRNDLLTKDEVKMLQARPNGTKICK